MTLFKNKYRIESTRLKGWDYGAGGYYFITICTRGMECFFGAVENGAMQWSAIGAYARDCWQAIPQHTNYPVALDEYIIMPNHLHGILVLGSVVETLHCNVSTRQCNVSTTTHDPNEAHSRMSPHAGSVSTVIRSYKAAVTYWCNRNGFPAFAWQSRFHDHIIRDENELAHIQQYICNNPAKWEQNRNNPANLWM